MTHPAADRREPPRLIAIASGKGGVGKTWLAITMCHALAQAGQRVLLFDGDLGLANVDIQLGLHPSEDLSGVLQGRLPLADARARHEAGFDILPGRSDGVALSNLHAAELEALLTSLRELGGGYDRVVLDLSAGLDWATRRMAAFADLLLVVATEEPTSLTDAYAVLKLHRSDRLAGRASAADWRARIAVNLAGSVPEGRRTYDKLARACANFLGAAPGCAGIVRRDMRVRDAIQRQTPLLTRHPASAAAQDVRALAAAFAG